MKVALVHDYLSSFGGAEVVLAALHEMWPASPIYTIFSKVKENNLLRQKFGDAKIIESWFGRLPFCEKLISPLRFLIPWIWKSFDFSQYDLVVSSASWAITKGFGMRSTTSITGTTSTTGTTRKKLIEICYCHTPPRYLYGYETSRDWKKNFLIRLYALVVNHFMRMYDFQRAQKVTQFVANSREVQSRIKKFYRREAVVIWPLVEVRGGKEGGGGKEGRGKYFLAGGRLEMPKNFDLIIRACGKLGVELKIYGSGPQEEHLKSISGPTIEFLGKISDEDKWQLMANCQAFIVAAKDEDFGITPVEAMAAGRPVIAYRGGGYLETVVEGKTGVFFDECSAEGVIRGIREIREIRGKIKTGDCRKQAEKFSKERFVKEFKKLVEQYA